MPSLTRLLRPKSIAVIGGGAWCENVLTECQKMGFDGEIWPVHPAKKTINNLPVYASLTELPSPPDATFIGVNRHATIELTRELNTLGAGGAVCFASGFSEATGEDKNADKLQQALLDAAGDMTIIGPNCYGFINYLDGALLWPDQHGGRRVSRGVAIITQSSNIAINLSMQRRGLPVAYLMTAGNQAQMGLSAIGAALLDDTRVTALGLHIEGLDDLAEFEALATKARDLNKPIVALKVGRSDAAQAAAKSHTASISGSAAGAAALLARLGVAQVDGLGAFLESLKLFHTLGAVADNALASMSCSGGEASLIADLSQPLGLHFPPLTAAQEARLRIALGGKVALANPLDYHTYIWGDNAAMTATFTAMMAPHLALGFVVLDIPRGDRCTPDAWLDVTACIEQAQTDSGVPIAIISCIPENLDEALIASLMEKNILALGGMEEALAAIKAGVFIGQSRKGATPPALLPPRLPENPSTLNEFEAKDILSKYGMQISAAEVAQNPAEAGAIAERIGFPVVLKGLGFAHKTEAGAVALNLYSAKEVATAAEKMNAQRTPQDFPKKFLIEKMIEGAIAELLIGVVCDAAHGYTLTIGAGGTLSELMDDSITCLIPTPRAELASAISGLKSARLLAGYRGTPPANMDAVLDAICALQDYVIAHHGQIAEAEINPLICTQKSAICADALIVASSKTPNPKP